LTDAVTVVDAGTSFRYADVTAVDEVLTKLEMVA
jgi:hypothetical protein